MSTGQCRRLLAAYRYALTRPTPVLVLGGTRDFFSNGIHLNVIEASDDPAAESWTNLGAIDDLVEAVLRTTDRLVVAALGGNAAAGGVMLALAADEVWCRTGAVLNPHYRRMGLYGSEFWTYSLPRRTGAATAERLTTEALPVSAATAHGLGLVDREVPVPAGGFTTEVERMAAELAEDEGIQVAKVLVNDDVAVTDSLYTAGRRGTGATLFVEKIAGAAADEGQPLERVEAIARQVNEKSRSFGVALSACTTPAKGSPTFDLPPGELELGIGIHGEPGRERRPMMTSGEIADFAVHAILEDLHPGNPVLLLVNGMGATPLLELYGFNAEVHRVLAARGVAVARTLVGDYVTSLDMAGASVTLCQIDEELLRLWDAPVSTPGLRWGM
ncbi:hypothetical protein C1I97_36065 [Streptomyces sp. NTH33]|nr:hypothetical protein C1I97_36065 [Streptomyces sp. NTH33]